MANFISILRIVLSIILLFFKSENNIFFVIYSICGLTDVLDGYIARLTKTESIIGSKLDSIADLFFGIVIIKLVFPIVLVNKIGLLWIIAIGVIKIISILIVFKKYKTLAIIHTYLNKITGIAIFFSVYFIASLNSILYLICFIATITAIEELCINLKSTKLETDTKSIFFNYFI